MDKLRNMTLKELPSKNATSCSSINYHNLEISEIKQDLYIFKKNILKNISTLEEKLNLKLSEQKITSTKQYNMFEKKIDLLSTNIIQVNSLLNDNTDFSEKINNFILFKYNAEESINKLNSKIINIQKDYKNFMITIEKIINDNLNYPGIIGTNSIFSNFRYFIDYILKTLEEFQTFKEKIENSILNIDNTETNNIIEAIKNNNNEFKEQENIKKNKNNKLNVNNALSAKNNKYKIEQQILNSKKLKNQTVDNEIKRSDIIFNDLFFNNKFNPSTDPIRNIEDKFNNNNEKKKIKNIDYFTYKGNNRQKIEKSNSFDKNKNIIRLTNHHLINKNNDLKNITEEKSDGTFLNK